MPCPRDHLDFHANVGTAPGLIGGQSRGAEFSRECQAGAIPKREAEGSCGGPEVSSGIGLGRREWADIKVQTAEHLSHLFGA